MNRIKRELDAPKTNRGLSGSRTFARHAFGRRGLDRQPQSAYEAPSGLILRPMQGDACEKSGLLKSLEDLVGNQA